MNRNKFFALVVSVVAVGTLAAGCVPVDQPQVETTPEPTPAPVVYTMAAVNWPGDQTQLFTETTIGRQLFSQTNTRMDITYLNGDTQQQLARLAASDDLPDMIWADQGQGELAKAGKLVDLSGYLQQDPEGIASYYHDGELAYLNDGLDGTYVLGTQRLEETDAYTAAGYYLRYDVLEAAGFPQITTLAQFCQLIEEFLAEHPTNDDGSTAIGLGLAPESWQFGQECTGAFADVSGYLDYGVITVEPYTMQAKMTMQAKWLKDWLRVINDLYDKKCLDPDIFTQTQTEYEAKIKAGQVLGFYDPDGQLAASCAQDLWEAKKTYVGFPVVLNGVARDYYRGVAQIQTGGLSITTSCADPDKVFEFIKLMASDDVQMLSKWGVEGVDYSFTEEGRFTRTATQWENMRDESYCVKRGIGMLDFFPNREGSEDRAYAKFIEGNWTNPEMSDEYPASHYTDYQMQIISDLGLTRLGEMFAPVAYPTFRDTQGLYDSLGADDPARLAVDQAVALAGEYHEKLITAAPKKLDDIWEEYQDELSKIEGLTAYEEQASQWIAKGLAG